MKDIVSSLESSLVEELAKSIDSEILKRVMSMDPTRSEKIRSILKKLNNEE